MVNNPSSLSEHSSKNSRKGVMVEPRQEKGSNVKPKFETNNSKMSNNDNKKNGGSF